MKFAWMGFLKSEQPIDPSVQVQISGFLQQPILDISSAGFLRGPDGERSGYLAIFEAEHREAAEALVRTSPLRNADLYKEYHLFEFHDEIG